MSPAQKGSGAGPRGLVSDFIELNRVEPNSTEIKQISRLIKEIHNVRRQLEWQNKRLREQKKQLEKSHRLFFRLFNLAPLPLVFIDKDLKVTDANKAALELFGPRCHFLGSSFYTVVDEVSLLDFYHFVHEGTYDGRKLERELTLKIALGRRSPFLVHLASIYLEGDGLEGYLLDVEDLSNPKKDNEEEQEASTKLEEVNVALKVLLENQKDKVTDLKESVAANKTRLIDPILKKLLSRRLTNEQKKLTELLRINLEKLTIDFAQKLSSPVYGLTPRELEVANLIRSGLTSYEIADTYNISLSGVLYHRNNIRKKLGLNGKRERLVNHLRKIGLT